MNITRWLMSPKGLALDRWLVKNFGFSLLNKTFARQAGFKPRPALLLETTGKKTGQPRSAVLPYFELDQRIFVVGSKGGAPTDPFWVGNLRANPSVTIYRQRKKSQHQAVILDGEQYQQYWQRISDLVPTYKNYQANTRRQIPVIELC